MSTVIEEDGTEREWTFGEMMENRNDSTRSETTMEAYDPDYKAKMSREFMTKLFLSDWYKERFK